MTFSGGSHCWATGTGRKAHAPSTAAPLRLRREAPHRAAPDADAAAPTAAPTAGAVAASRRASRCSAARPTSSSPSTSRRFAPTRWCSPRLRRATRRCSLPRARRRACRHCRRPRRGARRRRRRSTMSSEFPASGTARAGRGEQGTMLGDRERLVAVGGERVAPRVYLLAERENGRCAAAVRRTFRGGGKIWILCGRAHTRHDERRGSWSCGSPPPSRRVAASRRMRMRRVKRTQDRHDTCSP